MKWVKMVDQETELTPREIRVLRLAAKGLKTTEIAAKEALSPKTVEHMLGKEIDRGIYRKLEVKNRPEATAWFRDAVATYYSLRYISERSLYWTHKVRFVGHSRLAVAQAAEAIEQLRKKIDRRFNLLGRTKLLLKALARLLFEQIVAFFEIALPNEIRPFVGPRIEEMQDIAKACDNDREILGLADYAAGVAYYLTGNLVNSVKALKRAWANVDNDDNKLKDLRMMALVWAYLKEKKTFEDTVLRAKNVLEDGNFSNLDLVCMTYEGMGRGQGLFGLPAAFDTLDEGWRFYREMTRKRDKMPIRYVQLVRSELEVLQYLAPNEVRRLEEQGQKGLQIAEEHGYPRYAGHIQQFLDRNLN
jgi:DNA-binding CsgD family transcriptional regulator